MILKGVGELNENVYITPLTTSISKGLNQENINIGRESWSIYTVPISPQLFNTCSTAVKN
jgi:hypothetical protein